MICPGSLIPFIVCSALLLCCTYTPSTPSRPPLLSSFFILIIGLVLLWSFRSTVSSIYQSFVNNLFSFLFAFFSCWNFFFTLLFLVWWHRWSTQNAWDGKRPVEEPEKQFIIPPKRLLLGFLLQSPLIKCFCFWPCILLLMANAFKF